MLQSAKQNTDVYSKEFYLFSVEKDTDTKREAKKKTDKMRNYLEAHETPYKTVDGSYKGIKETSFLVPVKNMPVPLLYDLYNVYSQESILRVLPNGSAYLEYEDRAERIGEFKQVSILQAKQNEAYTIDGNKGYIVE